MLTAPTPWWRHPPAVQLPIDGISVQTGQRESGVLPFRALLVFTFILLLAPQEWFPVLAPLRIALLAAGVAMLAHAQNRWQRGSALIDFTPPVTVACVLAMWAIVTVPLSVWPGGSVSYLLDVYFKTLIVFMLLTHVVDSVARLKTLGWALVLMAVPLALTTLQHYLSGASYAGASGRVVGYSSALTANPNDMALMLNLILPVCIALFLASRKAARKWLLAGIFGLLVLAILATFSRAGFLTLGVSCLCYLWLLRNRRERFLGPLLLVLLVIALPLVPADYVDRLKTIVSIEDDASGSAQTRLGDIGVALGVVLEHPVIGSGIGMNALALNEARGTTWTQVHNVYLQIAVELGLPGLTMFLLLYARCLGAVNAVLRNTRTDPQSALYCLAEGIKVSLLAFGVAAMFHPVAWHFYFYYIAGLALATHNVWLARGGRA